MGCQMGFGTVVKLGLLKLGGRSLVCSAQEPHAYRVPKPGHTLPSVPCPPLDRERGWGCQFAAEPLLCSVAHPAARPEDSRLLPAPASPAPELTSSCPSPRPHQVSSW